MNLTAEVGLKVVGFKELGAVFGEKRELRFKGPENLSGKEGS